MFTILVVSFDIRDWQPADLIDYPRRATLVGELSRIVPDFPEQFENSEEAIAAVAFFNNIYAQAIGLLTAMTGLAKWAVVLPQANADEILALEKGQWFSMTFMDDVAHFASGHVEHMAAPAYHDKFSVN